MHAVILSHWRMGANSISITLSPSKVGIEHILLYHVDIPLYLANVHIIISVTASEVQQKRNRRPWNMAKDSTEECILTFPIDVIFG